MKPSIIIWHNNNCGTSRKVLQFLEDKGSVQIINYLKDPPSVESLRLVLKQMGNKTPEFILRKKDKVNQELFLNKNLNDEEWLEAMSQNPSIIERPIVIVGEKAFLARPFDAFVAQFTQEGNG